MSVLDAFLKDGKMKQSHNDHALKVERGKAKQLQEEFSMREESFRVQKQALYIQP
eukprot:UN08234